MCKKLLYEQPDCELLVVRFEEALLINTVTGERDGYDYYDLDDEEGD